MAQRAVRAMNAASLRSYIGSYSSSKLALIRLLISIRTLLHLGLLASKLLLAVHSQACPLPTDPLASPTLSCVLGP